MNITLGTHDEPRRAAVLRWLAAATDSTGRNGEPSISELAARLADVAETEPAATAAALRGVFALPNTSRHERETEIEAAAMTLLAGHVARHSVWNPTLYEWVISVGSDPAEERPFGRFSPSAEAAARTAEFGFTSDGVGFPTTPDDDLQAYTGRFGGNLEWGRQAQATDRAALWLGLAITGYRQAGRPALRIVPPSFEPLSDYAPLPPVDDTLIGAIGRYQAGMIAEYTRREEG